MAVTQYIGARYAPIFADPIEHSSAKTYEPLTIVLHEGNSYTSKQFVPKGIQITNEAYWAETGNYNAQVEQYRRETQQAYELAQGTQNDLDTLLPKADFSAENTVKKYVDDSSENTLEDAKQEITNSMKRILNISEIPNARIRFRKKVPTPNSMQGCCPFSPQNNYNYDSDSLYFAIVMGTDSDRRIEVVNQNGTVLSQVAIPEGHFGNITYNAGKIYTLNYTTGDTRGVVFVINVTNPNAIYIESRHQLSEPFDSTATYNFWHNGKLCIGVRTGQNVAFYDYDLTTDNAEYLFTIKQPKYPVSGRFFAHYTYDATNDLIIWNGYGPNGFIAYDSNGTLVNNCRISDILNFARIGEIEEITVVDNKIWFGTSVPDNAKNQNVIIGFFFYDLNEKIQNQFLPNTIPSTYVAHVNPIVDPYGINESYYSDNSALATSNQPIFTFFEDAVNFFNYLHNNGYKSNGDSIRIHTSFNDHIIASGLTDCSIIPSEAEPGKVPNIILYNCSNVFVNTNLKEITDDTYTYQEVKTWLQMFYSTDIRSSAFTDVDPNGTNVACSYSTYNTTSLHGANVVNQSVVYAYNCYDNSISGRSMVFANAADRNTVNNASVFLP